MAIRFVICPVIKDADGIWRPKVMQRKASAGITSTSVEVQTDAAGVPVKSWCALFVQGTNLKDMDADTEIQDIIEKVMDASGANTRQEAIQFLKNTTRANLTAAQRNAIAARMTEREISTANITASTTLFEIVQRFLRAQEPAVVLDKA